MIVYFVEDAGGPAEIVKSAGLSRVLEAPTSVSVELPAERVGGGEGTVRGLLLAEDGRGPVKLQDVPLAYLQWEERIENPAPTVKCWMSEWGETTPEELKRRRMIDGHLVRMGDERKWLIPMARKFPAGTALPMTLRLRDGVLEGEVLKEFADFSAVGERLFEFLYLNVKGDGEVAYPDAAISWVESFEMIVGALGINYRVEIAEANLLGLVRDDRMREALGAIVDEPGALEHVKKKRSDGGSE